MLVFPTEISPIIKTFRTHSFIVDACKIRTSRVRRKKERQILDYNFYFRQHFSDGSNSPNDKAFLSKKKKKKKKKKMHSHVLFAYLKTILAHQIKKSRIKPWGRNSYRTQVILPRVREKSRFLWGFDIHWL